MTMDGELTQAVVFLHNTDECSFVNQEKDIEALQMLSRAGGKELSNHYKVYHCPLLLVPRTFIGKEMSNHYKSRLREAGRRGNVDLFQTSWFTKQLKAQF
jgi:hypothetical protein